MSTPWRSFVCAYERHWTSDEDFKAWEDAHEELLAIGESQLDSLATADAPDRLDVIESLATDDLCSLTWAAAWAEQDLEHAETGRRTLTDKPVWSKFQAKLHSTANSASFGDLERVIERGHWVHEQLVRNEAEHRLATLRRDPPLDSLRCLAYALSTAEEQKRSAGLV